MGQDTRTGPMPWAPRVALFAQGLNGEGRNRRGSSPVQRLPLKGGPRQENASPIPSAASRCGAPASPWFNLAPCPYHATGARAMNTLTLYRPPSARRFPLVRSCSIAISCLYKRQPTPTSHEARRGQRRPRRERCPRQRDQGGNLYCCFGAVLGVLALV